MIVVWGISRAQRNLIPTELHSVEVARPAVEHDGEGNARHAALEGAEEKLDQTRVVVASFVLRNSARSAAAQSQAGSEGNRPRSRTARANPRRVTMRLLSYNIHKGIGGRDRRYRLDRIIQVIQAEDPDFICLQEVDRHLARSRHDDQPRKLSEALKATAHLYQSNVRLKNGGYGNLVLSRWPFRRVSADFAAAKAEEASRCPDGRHRDARGADSSRELASRAGGARASLAGAALARPCVSFANRLTCRR